MYRHHWVYRPGHPDYAHAWPTILADSRRIIEAVRRSGIVIAGPDGYRRPLLDTGQGLALNGDATSDLDGEPFHLSAPLPLAPDRRAWTAGCTTSRKPYDLAVAAILLRCTLLLPQAFAVASDGTWDAEWADGATPGTTAPRLGARTVIADLFDVRPPASPLRTSVAELHPAPGTLGPADTGRPRTGG